MATFYQGYKSKNLVLDNYFKGKFLCNNGTIEMLGLKTNKYNVEFIGRINGINKLWYGTIIADKVVIELLKRNSNNEYVEINNIWRLLKAQSATLKYNRLLKASLKKYAVNKQKIYDEIKHDLDTQDERIIRNRRLLIELCNDYGLGFLIDIVEKENNMDIIDHIVYYTDSIGKDLLQAGNKSDTEEEIEYYNEITNAYIDYLSELAKKYGKTLNNDISNNLKQARQVRDEKIAQNKKEIAEKKQAKKQENTSIIIANDNMQIQTELDASFDYKFRKITETTYRIKLRDKIKANDGVIYYIALCRQTIVNYISVKGLSLSIKNAMLFENIESAQAYIDSVRDKLDLKNANIKVQKLVAKDVNVETMGVYKLDGEKRVIALETILNYDEPSAQEIQVLKQLLYTKDYEYNNGEANVFVIFAQCKDSKSTLFGKNGFLREDYTQDELLTDISYRIKYFNILDNDSKMQIDECIRLLNSQGYSATVHKLHIKSELFKRLTLTMDVEHQFLVDVLSGVRDISIFNTNAFKDIYGIPSRNICYKSFTKDALKRLDYNLCRTRIKGEVFYICGCSASVNTNTTTKVLNINNKYLSEGIQNATFFESYEQAKQFIPRVLKETQSAKIYNIYFN